MTQVPGVADTDASGGRRLGGGAIASLVGVGLLASFMLQNTEEVRLDFLFWTSGPLRLRSG